MSRAFAIVRRRAQRNALRHLLIWIQLKAVHHPRAARSPTRLTNCRAARAQPLGPKVRSSHRWQSEASMVSTEQVAGRLAREAAAE